MAGLEKYGCDWSDDFGTQLEIELGMIRFGAEELSKMGSSLFQHYRNAQSLLFPTHDHHRWSDLILKTYCEEEITVLLGCSDSSKTFSMAKIILVDYWAWPDETLWLVSTTEGRGSELRVWGVIKDLFNEARREYDFLQGNPIDYLKTITTEEIDEDKREARSLRRGVIVIPCKTGGLTSGLAPFLGVKAPRLRHAGDECFPAGTLVDTPSGKIPIETIRVGDKVVCATGVGTVSDTMNKRSRSLVTIKSKDGRQFTCTPDHPVFTNFGWKKALELNEHHYMLSAYEAMCLLRKTVQTIQPSENLCGVSGEANDLQTVWGGILPETSSCPNEALLGKVQVCVDSGAPQEAEKMREVRLPLQGLRKPESLQFVRELHEGLQTMRDTIYSKLPNEAFLQSQLLVEVQSPESETPRDVLYSRANQKDSGHSQAPRSGRPGVLYRDEKEAVGDNDEIHGVTLNRGKIKTFGSYEPDDGWSPDESSRWKWNRTNQSRIGIKKNDSRVQIESWSQNRQMERERLSTSLQAGFGDPRVEVWRRSRWSVAPDNFSKTSGREEGDIPCGSWVDSVTHHEQKNYDSGCGGEGGTVVYNLSVKNHPSYSVNGFLVHNCQVMSEGFLNAYANFYGKEDFKGIMAGNFMEMDDPLGMASEPVGGWDSFVDTGKTQTWRTKFYSAMAVALDGRDSCNFDFPSPNGVRRYKYMIGQKKLDETIKTHGKDSWQWYSQCVGKPAKGMDIWRVLTRDFCAKHRASEDVIWKGEPLIELYALDPAYGGGDRCVGRHLQMGLDLNDVQILLVHPPEILPIKLGTDKDAEAQIAEYVFQRMKTLGIPAENCGYDSFGRGTLGFEFARFFGMKCPEPVDSGAQPTARPVRFDLFVEDRDRKRRLKRCDEQYKKFITELYFSSREAIDSEQIRGLDVETIREGCSRKFTKLPDGKIELETKDDYKDRNRGRSPDFYDNFVIGVEIARRRGLRILRLGKAVEAAKPLKPSTLEKWLEEKSEFERSYELDHV